MGFLAGAVGEDGFRHGRAAVLKAKDQLDGRQEQKGRQSTCQMLRRDAVPMSFVQRMVSLVPLKTHLLFRIIGH